MRYATRLDTIITIMIIHVIQKVHPTEILRMLLLQRCAHRCTLLYPWEILMHITQTIRLRPVKLLPAQPSRACRPSMPRFTTMGQSLDVLISTYFLRESTDPRTGRLAVTA